MLFDEGLRNTHILTEHQPSLLSGFLRELYAQGKLRRDIAFIIN